MSPQRQFIFILLFYPLHRQNVHFYDSDWFNFGLELLKEPYSQSSVSGFVHRILIPFPMLSPILVRVFANSVNTWGTTIFSRQFCPTSVAQLAPAILCFVTFLFFLYSYFLIGRRKCNFGHAYIYWLPWYPREITENTYSKRQVRRSLKTTPANLSLLTNKTSRPVK